MDRGTFIRTIVLFIALANQFLASFGLYVIPGTEEQQTELIAYIITAAASIVAWFKNNYVTAKGKQQKELLIAHKLAKED